MTENPTTPPAGASPAEKITFNDMWLAIEGERARAEIWAGLHAKEGNAALAALMRRRERIWSALGKTIDRVGNSAEIKAALCAIAEADRRAAEMAAADAVDGQGELE
jgi:hypothetical protein